MSASEALPAVLDRIDRDLDASLDRLFALLRIQSVSTDPAYAPQCRAAAEHVAADLRSLGLETSVRPTEGHPVVVGKSKRASGRRQGAAHPVLRPLRRAAGRSARSMENAAVRAAHRKPRRRAQDHRRARRLRRQRPGHDLRRGLPRLQGGDRQASARHHHDDRGRGGVRLEAPVRLRARQRRRVQARPGARLRHRHVGRRNAVDHDLAARAGLRGGEAHLRRPRSAFRAVRRRGAQSDPCAGRRPFGAAQAGRLGRHPGFLRRRSRAAARHQSRSRRASI